MKLLSSIVLLFSANIIIAQQTITFFHYNDMHAHLVTHKDLVRHGAACSTDEDAFTTLEYRGGVARLKYLIDSLTSLYPNNVFMNIGDTYHGGVEALYTTGNAIVDPVNAIGFDIGVPGNWDFAYGPGVFRKRYTPDGPFPAILNFTLPDFDIKSPNFTYLAANLTYSKINNFDPSPDQEYVLPPTSIKNIGGVDVGFIGITSDIVPTMHTRLAMGFNFLQGENNYIHLIETLSDNLKNEGVKVVVVLSELGIHKDYQIAQNIEPGSVDVFFSAHTHEITYEPITSESGALVVEAGNDGYLGQLDLLVREDGNELVSWQIIPISADIPENSNLKEMVESERAIFLQSNPNLTDPMGTTTQSLNSPITDTIGFSNITLSRINSLESNFNDAFTDIMRYYSGTQLAISPGFRFDSPTGAPGTSFEGNMVASGEITIEDIYRFFPVFYSLATAEIKADSLETIIEKLLKNVYSTNAFEQGGGWVDGFSGIKVDVNLSNEDHNKVLTIFSENGDVLAPDDILSVSGCQRPFDADDILCSHSGFINKTDMVNPNTDAAWTPQQIIEEYLSENIIEERGSFSFFDYSQADIYPFSPWVQPLPEDVNCALATDVLESYTENDNVKIYPNPTDNEIFIQSQQYFNNVRIYNALGKLVYSSKLPLGDKINITPLLPRGMYFIQLLQQTQLISTQKLLVE